MSIIERSIDRVMDSIELYDLDWLEDAVNLIEEYTYLDDDSPAQDAAMYVTGRDGLYLFDILFATYLYCVGYYDGQRSREYEVLSQLKTAGLRVQGSIEDQDESIQDLYARMVEVHHA
jgi:hypothetical protein